MNSESTPQDPIIADVSAIDPALEPFACLASAEAMRRDKERQEFGTSSLAEFECQYFGPEVGSIRRAFNAKMLANMKLGGRLLDYGCGGAWWKSDYWPKFAQVTACEVDREALREIASDFPEARLWWTRNGLIETEDRFDVVLSSSVVGYILPEQAARHLECAYRVLEDGGQLVMTRVLAYDLISFLRSRRLVSMPGPSFAYHYRKTELENLLYETGFKAIRYLPLGVRLPGLSWRHLQKLYAIAPNLMSSFLPKLLPFLKIQHMLIAEK